MRPLCWFLDPHGRRTALGPGDIIGRLPSAALHLDDGRVSEAHALVSLRGGELKLLGLRGLFAVAGKPLGETTLQAGLEVELARGLVLRVEQVELPQNVLGLEGDDLPRQALPGVASLVVRPRPRLVARYEGDAAAHLWSVGPGWRLQLRGQAPRVLEVGDVFEAEGHGFHAVHVDLGRADREATRLDGAVRTPLRLETHYTTVNIRRQEHPVITLSGIPARIVSELAAFRRPVPWEVAAAQVWPDELDRAQLRRRWDVNLARLRTRLREARLRPDLIHSDGVGNVELLLYDGDAIEDRC